jgi:MFS family permease
MDKNAKNKLIYYLSLIGFFAIFSTTISKNPVLSLYAKSLGATDVIIGLIAFFSPFAGILFSFPVGMLSDKIGRKKLLMFSAFVFLSAPLLYLSIKNPFYLIPIRFFHGIATDILGPVISAMIVDKYSENKGEMLGLYSSATLIGRTIAPLVGGFIISYFSALGNSINYRLVYVAAFIFALPIFILVLFLKEEKKLAAIKSIGIKEFGNSLYYFVSEPRLLSTAIVEMATYFAYGVLETYLPLYLQSKNMPAYEIGLIFSVQILSIALSKPIFGKISDKIDRRIQIIGGIITLGLAIVLFSFFSAIWMIIGIGILFGLGLSFSTVATSTYIADVTKKDKLGSSLGALNSIMDIGHSTGPFIAGVVISLSSYFYGFLSCFIVAVASAVFFSFAAFSKDKPEKKQKERYKRDILRKSR